MTNRHLLSSTTPYAIRHLQHEPLLLTALLLVVCFPAILSAQQAHASAMRKQLEDLPNLARNHGFVFIGNISSLRTRPQSHCASGVEHRVAYKVTEVLWSDPDSLVAKNYVVEKDYIDCRQKALPSSLFPGSKVIVYAEVPPAYGYRWLPPLRFTPEQLAQVQSWLADLRLKVGDPVLLEIRQRLIDQSTGPHSAPLVFLGQVHRISPMPEVWLTMPRRDMDVDVTKVLEGSRPYESQGSPLRTWCNSIRCAGLSVGAKVLGYCEFGDKGNGCLLSSSNSDANIKLLESWLQPPHSSHSSAP